MSKGKGDEANESTSLLLKPVFADQAPKSPDGAEPETVLPSNAQEHAALLGAPTTDEEALGDEPVARQKSRDDRTKQFEGVPELKRRMKYMFPAMGVGVMMAAAGKKCESQYILIW